MAANIIIMLILALSCSYLAKYFLFSIGEPDRKGGFYKEAIFSLFGKKVVSFEQKYKIYTPFTCERCFIFWFTLAFYMPISHYLLLFNVGIDFLVFLGLSYFFTFKSLENQ